MEPSGRNQLQPVAMVRRDNGEIEPKPLPWVATGCRSERMVRRSASGSTHRRTRASSYARRHAHHRTGTNRCVAPRSVRLSSPERVLFPDEGITKRDLFEYYRTI